MYAETTEPTTVLARSVGRVLKFQSPGIVFVERGMRKTDGLVYAVWLGKLPVIEQSAGPA